MQSSATKRSACARLWSQREFTSSCRLTSAGRDTRSWSREDALVGYDHVVVLSGDAPMITATTIERLRDFHLAQRAAMTLLSADLDNPTGYGRVLRKSPRSVEVRAIIEEKSATPSQKKICEINSGFYVFSVKELYEHIGGLSTANAHAEYYLTDMAEVLRKAGKRVVGIKTRKRAGDHGWQYARGTGGHRRADAPG